MKLQNKRIAILLEQQYQELEAWYPNYRLIEEGAEVHFIAPEANKEYPGKFGYPAKSYLSIEEVTPADYDAVIVPGGFAPDFMRRIPKMIEFVRQMNDEGKIVAAICHGGWILASAEIINGKKVTSFSAIKDDLIHAGGLWEDSEVVRHENIITSRKPDDLPAFCRMIISALD